MAQEIQIRRDTAANWTSVDPTMAQGELGYETDTDKLKIGDGVTAWTSLLYLISGGGGSGDVVGPGSAVDENITVFDGVTGKLIKDSAINISAVGSNTTHRTSDGSDHSFLDQSVISGATPVFTNTNFTEATDKNYVTDDEAVVIGNTSGTNSGDEDEASIAAINHAASVKSALVDADEVTGQDSADSFSLIRTTWTSVKAFLKTYFDTLYVLVSGTPVDNQIPVWTNDNTLEGTSALTYASNVLKIANSEPVVSFEDTDLGAVIGQEWKVYQKAQTFNITYKASGGGWEDTTPFIELVVTGSIPTLHLSGAHLQLKTEAGSAILDNNGEMYYDFDTDKIKYRTASTNRHLLDDAYIGSAIITTLGTITTGVWNGTALLQSYIGDGAINPAKLDVEFKTIVALGGGINLDWSAGQTFTKTLSGDPTYTFSNLHVGVKFLETTGDYSPTFPTGFTYVGGTRDASGTTLYQIVCTNTSTPVGYFSIYKDES